MPPALTQAEFIRRSVIAHNNRYDYSKVTYTGQHNTVVIICPVHGEFEQLAVTHQRGRGCYRCGRELTGKKNSGHHLRDTSWFLSRAVAAHGNKYDYSLTNYTGHNNALTIICPTHGAFLQVAHDHFKGSGCPRCASAGRSKGQDSWLDMLEQEYGPITRNQRVTLPDGGWLRPDGFKDNTFFEYWGDWAHGNPKFYRPEDMNLRFKRTFGDLYEATLTKRQRILDNGFKLVEIWEHEWEEMK